jgi:hypothetical protein
MDGDAAARHDLFSYALTDRAISMLTLSAATFALPGPGNRSDLLPHEVADAIAEFALRTRRPSADIAAIEIRYKSQAAIIARDGSGAFDGLRKLFVENLENLLAESGAIFRSDDKDYVIVEADDSMSLPEFAVKLLAQCQGNLSRNLEPSFRILDATGKVAVP